MIERLIELSPEAVSKQMALLDLWPKPTIPAPTDAERAGLADGDHVLKLHANVIHPKLGDLLSSQPPGKRGLTVAKLLLGDWIYLAGKTEQGFFPGIVGYQGTSPLAQPHMLRRLGAHVRPGVLNADQLDSIETARLITTGSRRQECPTIHHFIIDRTTMIEKLPVAYEQLERLERLTTT